MIVLKINGKERTLTDVDASTPLLWVLRDELGLTGTKYGCGVAQCGSCTVHVDGRAVRSCSKRIGDLNGADILTIEGLSADGDHPVQRAWKKFGVPQCGYCQAGQIMNAAALLAASPNLTDDDIDAGMAGNVCRCGTYVRIRAAIHEAAKEAQQ